MDTSTLRPLLCLWLNRKTLDASKNGMSKCELQDVRIKHEGRFSKNVFQLFVVVVHAPIEKPQNIFMYPVCVK